MIIKFVAIRGDKQVSNLPRGLGKHRKAIQDFVNQTGLNAGQIYVLRVTIYESGNISLTIALVEYIASTILFLEQTS